jgi:hypothetical protein
MNGLHVIDESVEVATRKLATYLRDRLIAQLYLAFAGKPLSQRGLARLFGLSQAYIARLIRAARAEQAEEESTS